MSPEKGRIPVHADPSGRFPDRQAVFHRLEIFAPLLPLPKPGQGSLGDRSELALTRPAPVALETVDPSPSGYLFVLTVGTAGVLGKGPVDLFENGIFRLLRIPEILDQKSALLGCQIVNDAAKFLEVAWVHGVTSLDFKDL